MHFLFLEMGTKRVHAPLETKLPLPLSQLLHVLSATGMCLRFTANWYSLKKKSSSDWFPKTVSLHPKFLNSPRLRSLFLAHVTTPAKLLCWQGLGEFLKVTSSNQQQPVSSCHYPVGLRVHKRAFYSPCKISNPFLI